MTAVLLFWLFWAFVVSIAVASRFLNGSKGDQFPKLKLLVQKTAKIIGLFLLGVFLFSIPAAYFAYTILN